MIFVLTRAARRDLEEIYRFIASYGIYYRRSSRRTVIVRVYHQARQPLEGEGN